MIVLGVANGNVYEASNMAAGTQQILASAYRMAYCSFLFRADTL